MERTFVDVGRRVETHPEMDPSGGIPRPTGDAVGSIGGELAKSGEALQRALRKGAVAIGHGIQDRRNEVIAYTRRQPMGALTAAAGVGFVVALCLAMGSRAATGGRGWRLQRNSRSRSILGRPTGQGWRSLLRLE